MRSLILAETVVDLLSAPAPGPDDGADGDGPRPFPGGTGANVAIHATRLGGSAALASGVGADHWGRWLRDWLAEEQVDLGWFVQSPRWSTPISRVEVDGNGEPRIVMEADAIPLILAAIEPRLEAAVATCEALFFASNTLCDPTSRRVTFRARELALAAAKPLLVDFNLRAHRWADVEQAAELIRAAAEGATLLKCNREEAAVLTGLADPEQAAAALCAAGSRFALISLGADGALLRDRDGTTAHAPAPRVAASSALGAGDALVGSLLGLQQGPTFDPDALWASLETAVGIASRSTESPGAVPPAASAGR